MTERIILSSIAQFIGLARANPILLSIGNFGLIRPALAIKPKSGCGKCGKKSGGNSTGDVTAYAPQFQAALITLTDKDKIQLKAILNANQICYYTKNTEGQLKLNCF